MAVFRVERTRDYTVMCNHHLKDSNLSLKAKGLLSMMLSLPDEWNYTTRGLAAICKEGVDAIGKTLKELELAGYIIRRQLRGKDGRISDTEYTIFEKPRKPSPPDTTLPDTENPYLDNPDTEAPDTDNPAQLNTTNMAAYLRKMAIDGYVVKLDLPELRELVSLLRYSSNNLNQLTRRAHETGRIYETDLEDIQQSQERIWTAAEKIVSSLAALK